MVKIIGVRLCGYDQILYRSMANIPKIFHRTEFVWIYFGFEPATPSVGQLRQAFKTTKPKINKSVVCNFIKSLGFIKLIICFHLPKTHDSQKPLIK